MEIIEDLWPPPLHGTTSTRPMRNAAVGARNRAPMHVAVEEDRRHISGALPDDATGDDGGRETPDRGGRGAAGATRRGTATRVREVTIDFKYLNDVSKNSFLLHKYYLFF
jgi:hypothetical protein